VRGDVFVKKLVLLLCALVVGSISGFSQVPMESR
jgi:hypothetical protein